MEMEKLITLKQFAEILGVHPITIKRMVWKRKMPCVIVNRLYKFKEADVEAYVKINTVRVVKDDNEQQAIE
jgi:excisionase family DNA binding protein